MPAPPRAILADPGQVAGNLRAWIAAFDAQIGRLDRAKDGELTT